MPKSREESNKRLGSLFRKSAAKSSIAKSAGAVASASNSASQSTESTSNSVAFSRALELLYNVDLSGDFAEGRENPLVDYIGRIENYANSRLPNELEEFKITDTQWQEVSLAAELAKRVHQINETSIDTTFSPGSRLGNTKPFCLHTAVIGGRTILVVAIRATRTLAEWAVNSNVDALDSEELGERMKCHRGLLSVARNMQPLIAEVLTKTLHEDLSSSVSILITGHSSGGAVGQLLFALMHSNSSPLAQFKSDDRVVNIDCITFGCPPVSSPPIPRPLSKSSMFFSFINEGDPIALAQKDYVQSLIQAWVKPISVAGTHWPIPAPLYIPSGVQVALKSEIMEDGIDEIVSASLVDVTTLETVLFGDLVMHSMTIYKDRIQAILAQAGIPQDPFRDQQ